MDLDLLSGQGWLHQESLVPLEVLSCQWALEAQHLPLALSCQGGRASLVLPCLLWLLQRKVVSFCNAPVFDVIVCGYPQ